jgi:hypothetical protein
MRTILKRDANKQGPLESYKMAGHCEMCGAPGKRPSGTFTTARLEPAFNPSGEPKTLCQDCRIGSAELLADVRADLLTQLKALVVQIEASGHLIVPPNVKKAIAKAEGKA